MVHDKLIIRWKGTTAAAAAAGGTSTRATTAVAAARQHMQVSVMDDGGGDDDGLRPSPSAAERDADLEAAMAEAEVADELRQQRIRLEHGGGHHRPGEPGTVQLTAAGGWCSGRAPLTVLLEDDGAAASVAEVVPNPAFTGDECDDAPLLENAYRYFTGELMD